LGMRTAIWLSEELGHLAEDDWAESESTLGRIPIKGVVETTSDRIFANFKRDKKGENRVILLRGIGEAFMTKISDAEARKAIDYMLSLT
jgi:3-dehydroquinate synthetase